MSHLFSISIDFDNVMLVAYLSWQVVFKVPDATYKARYQYIQYCSDTSREPTEALVTKYLQGVQYPYCRPRCQDK